MLTLFRFSARRRYLAVALAVTLIGAACGGNSDEGAGDGPVVVATTGIWADVVANVACDGLVEVVTIIPAGGDPHAFEPSLADRGAMDDSDLVVANGLGLEEGLADTIDASEATGTAVFEMADHVDSIPTFFDSHDDDHSDSDDHDGDGHGSDHSDDDDHGSDHGDDDDHGDEHDHEGDDPHIWFDPVRVAGALDDLGDAVVGAAGLDADAVAACVADYRAELEAVDAEIAAMVADLPESRRKLVTSHDSMGYFADRYGFTVVGTVIPAPSTLAQSSPAQLEDLAATIESTAVPAIFAEAQHSAADVEALASRVGDVTVVTLNTGSLGEPGSGADTYIGFLRTNAGAVTTALG
ncbi:MAG: metal ABC transporter substrate-binding protein [Acidimicrobiales bacterium]